MNKWMLKFLSAIPLVAGVVAGIEAIHQSAITGADKKALALQSLGLAGVTAGTLLPGDKVLVDGATQIVSDVIESTVKMFNLFGWPNGQPPKPVPPVIPAPSA
jgi:hypothetical protein